MPIIQRTLKRFFANGRVVGRVIEELELRSAVSVIEDGDSVMALDGAVRDLRVEVSPEADGLLMVEAHQGPSSDRRMTLRYDVRPGRPRQSSMGQRLQLGAFWYGRNARGEVIEPHYVFGYVSRAASPE